MALDLGNMFRTRPQPAPVAPAQNPQQGNAAAPGGMPNEMPNPGADIASSIAGGQSGSSSPAGGGTDGKKNANPMDNFKDLFTITDDDKKNAPPDPFGESLLTFDAKKFGEAATKMNFAAGISPELIKKALEGDAATFSSILNKVAQSAFTASAQVLTGVIEQGVKKNNGRWESALESRFRNMQINSQRPTNPALQHPAAQPLLAALKATISSKNNALAPDEVSAQAEEYFMVLAESIAKSKTQSDGSNKGGEPAETDWSKYLGM